MKKLLASIVMIAVGVTGASAQIILSRTSFPTAGFIGTDTLLLSNTVLGTTPSLAGAAGFNTNMSAFTSSANVSAIYRVAGTGSNQWADSQSLSFGSYVGYKANYESSLLNSGYVQTGIHIDRSALGLGTTSLAGAQPSDSIVINGQDIVFSTNRTRLAFPASYRGAWTSNYHFDFDFTVTFALGSFNNTPGIVRSYVTEYDSVIGYGKIQVRTLDGSISNQVNVLEVMSTVSTRDSFYLNNTLMTSGQLSLFQAAGSQFTTQGQTTVSNEIYYYRVGDITPMLHVTFDSANTHPVSAESQASGMPEFISETEFTRSLNVYPNPVTGHTIMISGAPVNYGNWNYELQNVDGQVITKGALQLSGNQSGTSIRLSNNVTPGTYFLHLHSNTAQETVRALTIQ